MSDQPVAVACPFCEAQAGQPCVTPDQAPRHPHFTRELAATGKLSTPVTTQRALLTASQVHEEQDDK